MRALGIIAAIAAAPLVASAGLMPFAEETARVYVQDGQRWARGSGFIGHFVHWTPGQPAPAMQVSSLDSWPAICSGPVMSVVPSTIFATYEGFYPRPGTLITSPEMTLYPGTVVTSPGTSVAPGGTINVSPIVTSPDYGTPLGTTTGGYTSPGSVTTVGTGGYYQGSLVINGTAPAVPEPASLALLALGATLLSARRR